MSKDDEGMSRLEKEGETMPDDGEYVLCFYIWVTICDYVMQWVLQCDGLLLIFSV